MGKSKINLYERNSLPMQECMHMPEPGSVLLAAFPNQCTTGQEGNYKPIPPRFWQEQTKRAYIFAQKGEASMVFTHSISPRTKRDSSLFSHGRYIFLLAVPGPASGRLCQRFIKLSRGAKSTTASSSYHLISAVQEEVRRYMSLSCLQSK